MIKLVKIHEGNVSGVSMSKMVDNPETKLFALDSDVKRPDILVNLIEAGHDDQNIVFITMNDPVETSKTFSTVVEIAVERPEGNGFWMILTDPLKYGISIGLIWVTSIHS